MPTYHGKLARRLRRQRKPKTGKRDLGATLGASRTLVVTSRPHGPFGLAALLDEIRSRLVSRGGRPSDPGPTIRRLVPIKKQVWQSLKAQAAALSAYGRRISPAQLAAMLVEKSLVELEIGRPNPPADL